MKQIANLEQLKNELQTAERYVTRLKIAPPSPYTTTTCIYIFEFIFIFALIFIFINLIIIQIAVAVVCSPVQEPLSEEPLLPDLSGVI